MNMVDYYFVIDKDKNVLSDSRVGDLDIEEYIDYTDIKDK